MMSAKTNLVLDLSIFAGFLVVAAPHLTGDNLHEWFGVALLAALVVHLLFHWDWVVKVTKSFFKKLLHSSRLNYVVNALFLVAMTVTMLSGLLISKTVMSTLGIQLNAGRGWETIHKLAADYTVILLGLHFALHFKWLISTLNRYVVRPVAGLFHHKGSNVGALPAPATVEKN